MKIIFLIFFTLLPILRAEDWTVNGKIYHNVTVGVVEADQVHITYDGGLGALKLVDLAPNVQKKLGYDPSRAAFAEQMRAYQAQISDLSQQNIELRNELARYKLASEEPQTETTLKIGIEAYHVYLFQTVVSLLRTGRVVGGPYDKMMEDQATAYAQQKWGGLSSDQKIAYEKMAQETGDPIAHRDAVDANEPSTIPVRILQGQGQ